MASLISILREVHDPRDVNARHDLASILFLALAATLCGAKSCVEMAEFSDGNVDELSAMVPLPHGAPSHDTFSRVFRLLDPAELARAFAAFMAALREELGLGPARGVVAVDAKSLRRGYEKGRAHMPPLMVSVWDTQTRLSIAQGRAPGNGEVKATLALLKGLVLKGCTVTADALHGHAEMARTVRPEGALLPRPQGQPRPAPWRRRGRLRQGRREGRRGRPLPRDHRKPARQTGAPPRQRAAGDGARGDARLPGPRRGRPHRGEPDPRRRHHPGDPLPPALAPLQPAQAPRHRQGALVDRKPPALDPRRRLRRRRRPIAQELRPGKPRRHPTPRPQHPQRPPRQTIHRQQNETSQVETDILPQPLCSSAIALPWRGR